MNERATRIEQAFAIPLLIAAVLTIPVVSIEQSGAGDPWQSIAGVLNWLIWIAFAIELVAMLVVVPDKWRWIRAHPLEVVIVLLTPPFLPATFQALRALRLLRLLRFIRGARLTRHTFSLEGVRYAAILAGLTAIGGGHVYALAESGQTPPPSAWDGTWWAASTMTTVGYGDEFPVTTGGRMLAIVLMVVGIGFVAILTGATVERFLSTKREGAPAGTRNGGEQVDDDVLAELKAISDRLRALESRLPARPG